MVYVRGHARDYDTWEEMGAQGWAYADVLPYFKRMENWHGEDGAPSDFRGTDGPLHITRGPRNNPLFDAFVKAGGQAGYNTTADYNGEAQEGFGAMEATIWKGRRWTQVHFQKAFLHNIVRGSNDRTYRATQRAEQKGTRTWHLCRALVDMRMSLNGEVSILTDPKSEYPSLIFHQIIIISIL
jgi:choline dehydrogenase